MAASQRFSALKERTALMKEGAAMQKPLVKPLPPPPPKAALGPVVDLTLVPVSAGPQIFEALESGK
jgi:hypothetical protein